MMLKPDAKHWTVREQIIDDKSSGLTFQFEVLPDGELRLFVFGEALPFGNREIQFHTDGTQSGAGTFTGLCRPAWATNPEELRRGESASNELEALQDRSEAYASSF